MKSLLITSSYIVSWQEVYGTYCFSFFGVLWVLPYSVKEVLLGWLGFCVGKKRKKVWFLVPLCLFWIVWMKRNGRVFENEGHSVQRGKFFFPL